MQFHSGFKSFLLTGAAIGLAACTDAEISSPGEGAFIGAPTGGSGGGAGGGGGSSSTRDLTFGGCPGGTSAQTIPGTNTLACQVLLDGSGNLLQNVTLTASSTQRRAYFFSQAAFVGTDDGTTPGSLGGTTVTLTIQPGAQIAFVNSTDFLAVKPRVTHCRARHARCADYLYFRRRPR